jgi:hypothetical protein
MGHWDLIGHWDFVIRVSFVIRISSFDIRYGRSSFVIRHSLPAVGLVAGASATDAGVGSDKRSARRHNHGMKSFEIIRAAVEEPGVKAVAAALKVSPALVYKWCEPPADDADPDQSGAKNPLDRVREMYLLTKDIKLIRWLCNEAGGFFIGNPVPDARRSIDENIFNETRSMVREFSELLEAVTESVENDSIIDPNEADLIRQKWEDLKSCLEHFVVACEKGHYRIKRKPA